MRGPRVRVARRQSATGDAGVDRRERFALSRLPRGDDDAEAQRRRRGAGRRPVGGRDDRREPARLEPREAVRRLPREREDVGLRRREPASRGDVRLRRRRVGRVAALAQRLRLSLQRRRLRHQGRRVGLLLVLVEGGTDEVVRVRALDAQQIQEHVVRHVVRRVEAVRLAVQDALGHRRLHLLVEDLQHDALVVLSAPPRAAAHLDVLARREPPKVGACATRRSAARVKADVPSTRPKSVAVEDGRGEKLPSVAMRAGERRRICASP